MSSHFTREPLRTMVDIDAGAEIVALLVYRPKAQLLLASNIGRGFAAEADELLAETVDVWSRELGRSVSEEEAIEMLLNVKRLSETLLAVMRTEG